MKNNNYKTDGTSEKSIIKMMIKDSTSEKKISSRRKKITESDIRIRAQNIYKKRISKGIPGDADSDWAQAEDDLNRKQT